MIGFGGTLMVIGVLGMFGSFGIDVSAPVTSLLLDGDVANIDAMSMREMTTIAFGFVFLAGAVFTASGALASNLTDLASRGAGAGGTAVRRERASTTKAVSSAPQTDEEFETRWKVLEKYDPDIQSALSKLTQFGNPAIEELKRVCKIMSDTSKLDFVVEIIKKNQIQLEGNKQKLLQMESNIDQKIDMYIQDEAKLNEYLNLVGLHIIKKGKKWIEVYKTATNAKLATVYSEEQLNKFLKKLSAERREHRSGWLTPKHHHRLAVAKLAPLHHASEALASPTSAWLARISR